MMAPHLFIFEDSTFRMSENLKVNEKVKAMRKKNNLGRRRIPPLFSQGEIHWLSVPGACLPAGDALHNLLF